MNGELCSSLIMRTRLLCSFVPPILALRHANQAFFYFADHQVIIIIIIIMLSTSLIIRPHASQRAWKKQIHQQPALLLQVWSLLTILREKENEISYFRERKNRTSTFNWEWLAVSYLCCNMMKRMSDIYDTVDSSSVVPVWRKYYRGKTPGLYRIMLAYCCFDTKCVLREADYPPFFPAALFNCCFLALVLYLRFIFIVWLFLA